MSVEQFKRLPTDVVPQVYKLFIKPNLKTFIFEGEEIIEIKIRRSTKVIVLNSVEIDVIAAHLVHGYMENTVPLQCSLDDKEELLTLQADFELPIGDAELHLTFSGVLNDKLKGFYRSKCASTDSVGDAENFCAVTQFAPVDARRCFPCWDEPAFKARFRIKVAVDNCVKVVLSNMPIKEERVVGDKRVVRFKKTPTMSTYLVAIVVGDFDYVEDKTDDDVLVRVYTPIGKKDQGTFALHVATKVLPYYNNYFQIAYPLPKIDLIAIADISFNAMENWGLVTYRESCLLVDNNNTSATTKQAVAAVVGHELAHQWFGNLVTMKWWTDLWLNEGYASFVQNLCVDYIFPEFDIWTQFVTNQYCRALELDALENSHPIEVPIEHPSEIDEIFDDISYKKGASIIRMLHRYIGDHDFRKGMNLYLSRHEYSNAETSDLWNALEKASSKPIRAIMSTWTKQKGFPIVTIENSIQNDDKRILIVSQKKFSTNQNTEGISWLIPLSFSSSKFPDRECFSTVLKVNSAKIVIPNISRGESVKLNAGTVGFYRAKYSSELLEEFKLPIKTRIFQPLDRLGLLDDLFALISTGQTRTVDVLKLIQCMPDEDNYTVWSNIVSCLEKIYRLLYNTTFDELFANFSLNIVKPISQKLGFEHKPNEGHLDTLLRSLIMTCLARFKDADFLQYAKQRFIHHCDGTNIIAADLRLPIYEGALYGGGRNAYNAILKLIDEADSQEEKNRLTKSFIALEEESVIKDALDYLMIENENANKTVIGVTSIALSKAGRDIAWNYVKNNWDKLLDRFKSGNLMIHLVKYTTESFASEDRANELKSFLNDACTDGVKRTFLQSIETILNNASWLKKDTHSILEFLKSQ